MRVAFKSMIVRGSDSEIVGYSFDVADANAKADAEMRARGITRDAVGVSQAIPVAGPDDEGRWYTPEGLREIAGTPPGSSDPIPAFDVEGWLRQYCIDPGTLALDIDRLASLTMNPQQKQAFAIWKWERDRRPAEPGLPSAP